MVHGAGALHAALARAVVVVDAAALVAARLEAVVAERLEAERLLEQGAAALGVGRVGAHVVEALQRELGRDLRMVGDQRLVARVGHDQLQPEALGVGEDERVAHRGSTSMPSRAQPLLPEVERLGGGDAVGHAVHHAGAGPPAHRAGVLEEGEVGAGGALLVGVEEVVDGGVVLVDGLLDQAQAQDARVEVDVAGRVAGDRGDVMDAFELHRCSFRCALDPEL